MSYRHVQIPGFGCTYVDEYEQDGPGARFRLKIVTGQDVLRSDGTSPSLAFPLEAGQAVIQSGRKTATVDFRTFQLIPAGSAWKLGSASPFLKVAVIEFTPQTLATTRSEFDLEQRALEDSLRQFRTLERTGWINEICHRYIFERAIAKAPASQASSFLERELLKEAYYAVARSKVEVSKDEPFFTRLRPPLQRALQHIEQHLFEPLNLDDLAKAAAASKPTLIRHFKSDLGCSPIRYVWNRRLEEARLLLATGRYGVAEVAEIIGYADISSFSHAFHERFGIPPSRS